MPKKYPPLTPGEVIAILKAWGFRFDRNKGSHEQYEGFIGGERKLVTVDTAISAFSDFLMGSMISQSGLSRDNFYCATKGTAKKINKKFVQPTIIPPAEETA